MPAILLTEAEAAERLRCSCQRVKRLRLNGGLAYIPGRPPLIGEADLASFIEAEKRRAAEAAAAQARAKLPPSPEAGMAAARQRAIRAWRRRGPLPRG